MKNKGPTLKLKVYCNDCEYLELKPRVPCGVNPYCKKLEVTLSVEHVDHDMRVLTPTDCPFSEKSENKFYKQLKFNNKAVAGNLYIDSDLKLFRVLHIGREYGTAFEKVVIKELNQKEALIISKKEFEDGRFRRVFD